MWQLFAGLAAIGGWLMLSRPGGPSAAEVLAELTRQHGSPAVRNVTAALGRMYRVYEWRVGEATVLLIVGGAAATRPGEPDVVINFRHDPTGPRVSDLSRLDAVGRSDVKEILLPYMPNEGT